MTGPVSGPQGEGQGGKVVACIYRGWSGLVETCARYANTYGLELEVIDCRSIDFIFQQWERIRDMRAVLVWNGTQHQGGLIARLARRRGVPVGFLELGMPQRETYFVDPAGFCGDSVLNGPLNWVNDHHRAMLEAERARMRWVAPLGDDHRTLALLQIAADSQILYHTPVCTMQAAVDHLERVFAPGSLVIRPHPKYDGPIESHAGNAVERSGSLLSWVGRCRSVVGFTSTSLYEAAIYGRPVLALGDHPMRSHAAEHHDDLAAAALSMRISNDFGNPADVLERFGVWPLGCGPRRVDCPGPVFDPFAAAARDHLASEAAAAAAISPQLVEGGAA